MHETGRKAPSAERVRRGKRERGRKVKERAAFMLRAKRRGAAPAHLARSGGRQTRRGQHLDPDNIVFIIRNIRGYFLLEGFVVTPDTDVLRTA